MVARVRSGVTRSPTKVACNPLTCDDRLGHHPEPAEEPEMTVRHVRPFDSQHVMINADGAPVYFERCTCGHWTSADGYTTEAGAREELFAHLAR